MATPADISGLGFYVKSDTGLFQDTGGTTPATSNTNPIGLWQDQSGNGYDLTQSTSGKRPTLELTSPYKSKPAIKFVAASSQYLFNAAFNLTSNPTGGTWVIAWQTAATSSSQCIASPTGGSLAVLYDNQYPTFYRHAGAAQYGRFNSVHPHGRLLICRYNSAGSGDAGKLRMRSNRIDRTLTFPNAITGADGAFVVSAGLDVGRFWGADANFLDGRLFELAYYTRTLTDAECDDLDDYFAATYFSQGAKSVHCIGDSLTEGYPITLDTLSYPAKLGTLLGSPWVVTNHGVRAYKIADLAATADAQIDADRDEWRARDVVIHQGGTNDFSLGRTVSEAIADMTDEVTDRKTTGFEVYVCTVPPRGDLTGGTTPTAAGFESDRTAYNTAVRNGDTGADGIIDWAADSRLSNPANATYYYSGDLVHFEEAGNDVAAELAADEINPTASLPNIAAGFNNTISIAW